MAQTNYTPISLYYSATASSVPVNTNLVAGELAINTNDGKLFYKDSSGVVQVLATKATGTISGSTGYVQFNNAGALGSNANFFWDNTNSRLGIGTTSPSYKLDVNSSDFVIANFNTSYSGAGFIRIADVTTTSGSAPFIGSVGNNLTFGRIGTAEYARIDSSGNLLVGGTSGSAISKDCNIASIYTTAKNGLLVRQTGSSASSYAVVFENSNGTIGTIVTNGSATTYNTSSDYRLKENVQPMVGALATVAQLKPVTYNWKVDGSNGQGFIAHELQEVVPDCVTGDKDAVDEEGNPKYQGVDTSFLVATLTKAIQELNAKVEALESK